jgi:hypothetical protein
MGIFKFEEFVTMLARVARTIFLRASMCDHSELGREESRTSKCVLVSVNDVST